MATRQSFPAAERGQPGFPWLLSPRHIFICHLCPLCSWGFPTSTPLSPLVQLLVFEEALLLGLVAVVEQGTRGDPAAGPAGSLRAPTRAGSSPAPTLGDPTGAASVSSPHPGAMPSVRASWGWGR